jgi:hypothetical protein
MTYFESLPGTWGTKKSALKPSSGTWATSLFWLVRRFLRLWDIMKTRTNQAIAF